MAAQVSISTQQCSELQQRLQDQQAEHESNSSDMGRMVSKVHGLEFDLGNLRQSLQVWPQPLLLILECALDSATDRPWQCI